MVFPTHSIFYKNVVKFDEHVKPKNILLSVHTLFFLFFFLAQPGYSYIKIII